MPRVKKISIIINKKGVFLFGLGLGGVGGFGVFFELVVWVFFVSSLWSSSCSFSLDIVS